MMVTYWDLDEAERAALSADDVQRYVDAELMLKGVLKVRPLVLEEVPDAPAPTSTAFVVRGASKYGRSDAGIAFLTLAEAQAFMKLRPMTLSSEYLESTSVAFTCPIVDQEIAEVPIFSEVEKNAARADLKRAATIKSSNERREREYAEAIKAQEKALSGLWEDWSACRERDAMLRAVADTFADYKRTAGGDDRLAASFLAKVYAQGVIAEAAVRFGFDGAVPAPEAPPAQEVSL